MRDFLWSHGVEKEAQDFLFAGRKLLGFHKNAIYPSCMGKLSHDPVIVELTSRICTIAKAWVRNVGVLAHRAPHPLPCPVLTSTLAMLPGTL